MQSRSRQETRSRLKKGISGEESRRKREDQCIEIRKTKRDEGLMQKRRAMPAQSAAEIHQVTQGDTQAAVLRFAQLCHAATLADLTEGVVGIRKLLSLERQPPIDAVVETGVLPRLVQLLAEPSVSTEAAWALTNVASGDAHHTRAVVQAGAVPPLVRLLHSSDPEAIEQAVWALGNIAGDSAECRNLVLQHGVLEPLLQAIRVAQRNGPLTLLRNAVWVLSNLCRGKPQPQLSLLSPALPLLAELIHSADSEVIVDSTWALSYLSDGDDHRIAAVLSSGVAPRLVALLSHSTAAIQTPALRAVGNIVTGSDTQTQTMLDLDLLSSLRLLLQSGRKGLRKESAWTISNITAGNSQQTQQVIDAQLLPLIISHMGKGEFDVKKECAWAVSNATTWRTREQIRYMVNLGCVKPLVDLLTCQDNKIVGVALDALENILIVGNNPKTGENVFSTIIEEAEGIDKLEELQSHENEGIYKKSLHLLETYFGGEEEIENLAPTVSANQNTFSFSSNVQLPASGFAF